MNGQHQFTWDDTGDVDISNVVPTSLHEHGPDEQQSGMLSPMAEFFGPPISVYTRAQAFDDGVLVDVSETAREAGIIYPVAITQRLWADYITPDDRSRPFGQSEEGRLWDVLYLLSVAARTGGEIVHYTVSFIMKERLRRTVGLKAVCGPGDDATPVITIMLPDED